MLLKKDKLDWEIDHREIGGDTEPFSESVSHAVRTAGNSRAGYRCIGHSQGETGTGWRGGAETPGEVSGQKLTWKEVSRLKAR